MQRRERLQHRHPCAQPVERCGNVNVFIDWLQTITQQGLISRLNAATNNRLDRLIPLIDRLLDQRVTSKRTDDVNPRNVRFVLRRYSWHAVDCAARKFDAERFDQLARWRRAKPRKYSMTEHRFHASCSLDRQAHHVAEFRRRFNQRWARAEANINPLGANRVVNQCQITVFATAEFLATHQHHYAVKLCQRDGVFNRRIARADDYDGLVGERLRRVQLIDHTRMISTGNLQFAQISLHADGQHHSSRVADRAVLKTDCKRALPALDRGDGMPVRDVDTERIAAICPALQHGLALGRFKRKRCTQRQNAGLVHHWLALLVFENRISEMR